MEIVLRLENYGARDSHVLDDTSGAWKETRFPLCHGALAFWSGMAPGNGVLDRDKLNGYYFAFTADPDRVEAVTRGAIELDDLACVEPDEWVDPCAAPDFESESVPGVHYATASAFASHTMKTDMCDELCAAVPACRFYAIETTINPWDGFPRCFLFDALAHDDIIPAAEVVDVLAFWATSVAKRGALCEVCACTDDGIADCRGRDLQTVPAAAGADATTIDLSDNPRLTLVGPGAFDGLDGLRWLPVASSTWLPKLWNRCRRCATYGSRATMLSASSTAPRSSGIAGRGLLVMREPGVVDAIYEETNADNIYVGFDHMRTLDLDQPTLRFWPRRPNPRRSVWRIAT